MADTNPDHTPCRVLYLDTLTGQTAVGVSTPFQLSSNNDSCDCNRKRSFGNARFRSNCVGCRRYLVMACSDPTYTLRELNAGYPERLLAEFCDGYPPMQLPHPDEPQESVA